MLAGDLWSLLPAPSSSSSFSTRDALSHTLPALLCAVASDAPDAREAGVSRLQTWVESVLCIGGSGARAAADEVLLACAPLLGDARVGATAARVLLGWLRGGGLGVAMSARDDDDALGARDATLIASLLVSVPDRAATGAARGVSEGTPFRVPAVFSPDGFCALLEIAICEAVEAFGGGTSNVRVGEDNEDESGPANVGTPSPAGLDRARALASVLVRRARTRSLGTCWGIRRAQVDISAPVARSFRLFFPEGPMVTRVFQGAFDALATGLMESAAADACKVRGEPNGGELKWSRTLGERCASAFGPALEVGRVWLEAARSMLLLRPMPGFISSGLVFYLGADDALSLLAEEWSSTAYATETDSFAQTSCARALVTALAHASERATATTSAVAAALLTGVSLRMDAPSEISRRAGLRVAAAVAAAGARARADAPLLDFEEIAEEDSAREAAKADARYALAQGSAPLRSPSAPATSDLDWLTALAVVAAAGMDSAHAARKILDDARDIETDTRQLQSDVPGVIGPAENGVKQRERSDGGPAERDGSASTESIVSVGDEGVRGVDAEAIVRFRMAALAPADIPDAFLALQQWASDNSLRGDPVTRALAALSTLPHMIRSAGEGMGDDGGAALGPALALAPSLIELLLALDDRAGWPGFAEWRAAALVEVAVLAPHLACGALISRASNMAVGEASRLDALDVLVDTSQVLRGARARLRAPPPPPWSNAEWDASPDPDDAPGADAERMSVEADIAAREPRPRPTPSTTPAPEHGTTVPSRAEPDFFSELAGPVFFWPLFAVVISAGGVSARGSASGDGWSARALSIITDASTLSSDARCVVPLATGHERLLAQAVRALGCFVETSGVAASPPLARALFPLAWELRGHADARVRAAALAAVAAVVTAIGAAGENALLSPSALAHPLKLNIPLAPHHAKMGSSSSGGVVRSGMLSGSGVPAPSPADISGGASVLSDRGVGMITACPIPPSGVLGDLLNVGARGADRAEGIGSALAAAAASARARAFGSTGAGLAASAASAPILDTWWGGGGGGEGVESALAGAASGGAPCMWDDLVLVASWLHDVASTDPDGATRALAVTMLQGARLRELVLKPLEGLEDALEAEGGLLGY